MLKEEQAAIDYWNRCNRIREALQRIETEDDAREYIDLMMSDDDPEIMLDVFCNAFSPVRWWEVYYADWC